MVPDVIDAGLRVLFVGINPGLYSGAIRHHFGRPGNRFWPALYAGGFTPRVLSPFEETRLLEFRVGLTNLVNRATAMAGELTPDELQRGARLLERKVGRFGPSFVAFLGLTSYRTAFARPKAVLGLQPEALGGRGGLAAAQSQRHQRPSPTGGLGSTISSLAQCGWQLTCRSSYLWQRGNILVGISGWSYAPWRGNFFPNGLPQKLELAFAARRFGALEVNGTFYSLQRPSTFTSWYHQTPPGFMLCPQGRTVYHPHAEAA